MIYFSGDTHGLNDFDKLVRLSKEKKHDRNYILIILGDCGVLFFKDEKTYSTYIKMYEALGFTVLYIDGNHENFPLIASFPEVEVFGAKANQIGEHLYHIKRGEILNIDGYSFLCMGGATSIDKWMRIEGESWWEEENISESDMENAWRNLEKVDYKVGFVLTHCIDSSTVFFGLHFAIDNNTAKLEEIEARVDYKMWLFGHYHVDRFLGSKKACLYERVGYLNKDSDILFDWLDL